MTLSAAGHSERAPLRVHHFVDGAGVTTPATKVFDLARRPVDQGRHGVPIAVPDEVEALVDRCGDGLARWMAIGSERRGQILRLASGALRHRTLDLAEAYADDLEIPAAATVAVATAVIDAMLDVIDTAPPSPLRPGIYVYMPSPQYAGPRFVPLLWPLLLGGSTLILHPELDKPRIGETYAALLSEAGLPDGVLNLIYGDDATTHALVSHPSIAGVLGVGPREHATALTKVAATFGKRLLTELLHEPVGVGV